MSRKAVSWEHLVILAHREVVRLPSSRRATYERLTLDAAARNETLCYGVERQFPVRLKRERIYAPQKKALPVPDRGELWRHLFPVPVEARPAWMLVNVHSSHHLRILYQCFDA